MLVTSLRRHSGRGRGEWWCIARGEKVTGGASCVFLQADPVWRNNSSDTRTRGVFLLPSHREEHGKAIQSGCENCGSIAERHTGGLAGVMGMFARVSTS